MDIQPLTIYFIAATGIRSFTWLCRLLWRRCMAADSNVLRSISGRIGWVRRIRREGGWPDWQRSFLSTKKASMYHKWRLSGLIQFQSTTKSISVDKNASSLRGCSNNMWNFEDSIVSSNVTWGWGQKKCNGTFFVVCWTSFSCWACFWKKNDNLTTNRGVPRNFKRGVLEQKY